MIAGDAAAPLNLLLAIANEQREAISRMKAAAAAVRSTRPQGAVSMPRPISMPRPDPPAKPFVASEEKKKSEEVIVPKPAPDLNPTKYLQELFVKYVGSSRLPKQAVMGEFVKPDEEETACYNAAVTLVRRNDLEKLKALYKEGKNLDACNRVGESLLHVACRRGHVEIAEFLMREAKVRVDQHDDFGRNVLHDACWRPQPDIALMDALLKVVSPELLLAKDIRGHTALEYSRKEHYGDWYRFLKEREDFLVQRLKIIS
jgi:hypothetical protein